ncbi:MAG: MCE family protein [bacterium]|nr:MCE family protein [bacterium]
MKNRNTEFRIGALVLTAIVISTTWLLFLKEFKFRTDTYPLTITFSQVAGLKSGAPVSIRGVEKGKVSSVTLGHELVSLVLEIEETTFISDDAEFHLKTDIVNPTEIRIEQGSSPIQIPPDQTVRGTETAGLNAMIGEGSDLVSTLVRLTNRVDSLTANGRLDKLLNDLEGSAGNLNAWTGETRADTRTLLAKLDTIADQLIEMMAENRVPLNETLTSMSGATVRADSMMIRLSDLADVFTELGRGIKSGEGTLGSLVESDVLYDKTSTTVARLDSLITEIMENPKKYISFSIF